MSFCQQLGIVSRHLPPLDSPLPLDCKLLPFSRHKPGSDQPLDLRGFRTPLLGQRPSHDVLPDVVLLVQVKELPDLVGSLRPESSGDRRVSETRDLSLSLLDDDQSKDREVGVDDASSDRLALPFSVPSGSIAWLPSLQKEPHSSVSQDPLHHREPLFIVSSGDPDDIPLPFISNGVHGDLCPDPFVVKDPHFLLVVDVEQLLTSCGRKGHVELLELGLM